MIGDPVTRVDGLLKVSGKATYAYEQWAVEQPLYGVIVGAAVVGESRKVEITQLPPSVYPDRFKQEIADFMRTYLNNPTKVKDAFVGQPVLRPVAGKEQYVTCVRYNPRDTKDYEQGVWTLPPTYRLGETDRQKYAQIGESDRFTLKFVKPKT